MLQSSERGLVSRLSLTPGGGNVVLTQIPLLPLSLPLPNMLAKNKSLLAWGVVVALFAAKRARRRELGERAWSKNEEEGVRSLTTKGREETTQPPERRRLSPRRSKAF